MNAEYKKDVNGFTKETLILLLSTYYKKFVMNRLCTFFAKARLRDTLEDKNGKFHVTVHKFFLKLS